MLWPSFQRGRRALLVLDSSYDLTRSWRQWRQEQDDDAAPTATTPRKSEPRNKPRRATSSRVRSQIAHRQGPAPHKIDQHSTQLSSLERVLTGTVLSPRLSCNHVAVEPFTKTEGVYLHRGCCSRPPKMAACRCEMTVSPLVPTEKPDSNLQDGIEEPRGSQEIGGTRFRLGMENCSQRNRTVSNHGPFSKPKDQGSSA